MNWFGHLHVARIAGIEDPGRLLGAMLPDLLGMVRARADLAGAPAAVAAGVAVHHRADELFHQHPSFTGLMASLRDAVAGQGLPTGAARAIGHVGIELLLDGRLAGDEDLVAAFRAAIADAGAIDDLVAPPGRDRWLQLRHWVVSARPDDYRDPAAVAERLHRILDRRPRLAFPAAGRAALGEALTAHLAGVSAAAPVLFADVAAGLTPVASPPPPLGTGR